MTPRTQPVTPGEVMKQEPSTRNYPTTEMGQTVFNNRLSHMPYCAVFISGDLAPDGRFACGCNLDDAIVEIERQARANTPSAEVSSEALHRLLLPPHPGNVYFSSALCSCGEWQYDADSPSDLLNEYDAVLRDLTMHLRAQPSAVSDVGALRSAFEQVGHGHGPLDSHISKSQYHAAMLIERQLREEAEAQVAALRSWIVAYGDHTGYCAKESEPMDDCTCGFDDLLANSDSIAKSPAVSDVGAHPVLAKYGLETMKGDPLEILDRHLSGNRAATDAFNGITIDALKAQVAALRKAIESNNRWLNGDVAERTFYDVEDLVRANERALANSDSIAKEWEQRIRDDERRRLTAAGWSQPTFTGSRIEEERAYLSAQEPGKR